MAKFVLDLDLVEEADNMMIGYCRECGAERECCEPDARNYECEACGANEVYGAQEYVIMMWVR